MKPGGTQRRKTGRTQSTDNPFIRGTGIWLFRIKQGNHPWPLRLMMRESDRPSWQKALTPDLPDHAATTPLDPSAWRDVTVLRRVARQSALLFTGPGGPLTPSIPPATGWRTPERATAKSRLPLEHQPTTAPGVLCEVGGPPPPDRSSESTAVLIWRLLEHTDTGYNTSASIDGTVQRMSCVNDRNRWRWSR